LYANKPTELTNLVKQIKQFSTTEKVELPAMPEDEEEGNEGQVLSRVHRYRERDKSLVKKKKGRFLSEHQRLFCQGCGFDFENKYGSRGKDFIECHHTKPVSELMVGEATKVSDLVLLCSNCHRIVHRKKPWLSVDELKKLIQHNDK